MELRHLRYFVSVAEAENVSRAALKLRVSQPALSRQIRDLEDELGFALLERTAKSVRLTEAGRVFLDGSRAVLQRVAEAVTAARARANRSGGELHVGYAPSPTARLLPATLRAFQSESPGVKVQLHDLSTEEMVAGLRQGKLQLALLVRPSPASLRGLQFFPLQRERLCVAVANGHPFARKKAVKLADVAAEGLIAYQSDEYPDYHELLDRLFAGGRQRPRIIAEHDGVSSIIAEVESGAGIALLPEAAACLAGQRLRLLSLSPQAEPLVIGAAWLKPGLTPSATRFLELAKAAAAVAAPALPAGR